MAAPSPLQFTPQSCSRSELLTEGTYDVLTAACPDTFVHSCLSQTLAERYARAVQQRSALRKRKEAPIFDQVAIAAALQDTSNQQEIAVVYVYHPSEANEICCFLFLTQSTEVSIVI